MAATLNDEVSRKKQKFLIFSFVFSQNINKKYIYKVYIVLLRSKKETDLEIYGLGMV